MSQILRHVNFLVKDFELFVQTYHSVLHNVCKASTEPNGWVWVMAEVSTLNMFPRDDTNIIQKDYSADVSY